MQASDGSELEFYGVKLKVNNPRLAALLSSDATDDVQVVGRRAREALAGQDDAGAERAVAERVRRGGAAVVVRVHDSEE